MAASQNVKPRSIPWTHRSIHTPDPYQTQVIQTVPLRLTQVIQTVPLRLDHRGPIHTRILTQPHIFINALWLCMWCAIRIKCLLLRLVLSGHGQGLYDEEVFKLKAANPTPAAQHTIKTFLLMVVQDSAPSSYWPCEDMIYSTIFAGFWWQVDGNAIWITLFTVEWKA